MRNFFLQKFLLVAALLFSALPTLADTTDDEQALTQYFYHHLLDMNPSLPDLSAIAWTDVSSAQEMVWRAWQQANAQLVEDGLPTLAPLTNEDYNRWILPEDLEPSAIMPFYFGYKGEASERPETGYPMYIFLHGSGEKDEEAVRWWAVTGPIGITRPDAESLCRLNLAFELSGGASVTVETEYDGDGRFEKSVTLTAERPKSVTLPILPRRAHYLRLRLSGEGDARLYSLAAVTEEGSDR